MNNKKPIKEKGGEDIGGQVVQDTTVPEVHYVAKYLSKINVWSQFFFYTSFYWTIIRHTIGSKYSSQNHKLDMSPGIPTPSLEYGVVNMLWVT